MITQKYLKECLSYNKETGDFVWLKRPRDHFIDDRSMRTWHTRYAGSVAGNVSKTQGYRQIRVNGNNIRAHRLVWLYLYGHFPRLQIDHIDGNKGNNALSNLRIATRSTNCRNQKIRADNKSVRIGVCFSSKSRKWMAYIGIGDGRMRNLGQYESKEEAILVRAKAERDIGYHPNHGRAR